MLSILRKIFNFLRDNFYAEQNNWIVWTPFLFGTGIGFYYLLPNEPNYWLSLAVLEIVLFVFYLLRYKNLHIFFIALLCIICGFINAQMHSIYQSKKVKFTEDKTTYLQGQITEITYNQKLKDRLLLKDVSDFDNKLQGNYRITISQKESDLQINQCVELVATVFPPSPIQIMNGFQLDRKYFYNSLSGIGYSDSEVFVIDCPQNIKKSSFSGRLNKVRKNITNDISKILPYDEAGVVDAILIGEKTLIPNDINENYRNSGLAHFLSVSGLHLGSIAGLAFFLIRFLLSLSTYITLRYDIKKISAFVAIIVSALYLLISGMEIPAQRAFIMTTVVLIGVIFNRQAISLRMISFAAFVLLLIKPYSLISISFQMSFAAVMALIAFYERYGNKIHFWNMNKNFIQRAVFYLIGIVLCDLVASLATTPFAIYHFHRIATYTSLGNLLAGPLIGLYLMPMILVCLITLPLGLSYYPIKLLGYGVNILNYITEYVAHLPNSVITFNGMPFWGFILIIFGGYWLCAWQQNWRKLGFIPVIIGFLSLFTVSSPDIVFSEKGKDFALRDNHGFMRIITPNTNNFLKKIWNEHFDIPKSNKKTKKKINQIYDGNLYEPDFIDLKCDTEKCIYKNKISLYKKGFIKINNKDIDNKSGGYIYLNKDIKYKPLRNINNNRIWHKRG